MRDADKTGSSAATRRVEAFVVWCLFFSLQAML